MKWRGHELIIYKIVYFISHHCVIDFFFSPFRLLPLFFFPLPIGMSRVRSALTWDDSTSNMEYRSAKHWRDIAALPTGNTSQQYIHPTGQHFQRGILCRITVCKVLSRDHSSSRTRTLQASVYWTEMTFPRWSTACNMLSREYNSSTITCYGQSHT